MLPAVTKTPELNQPNLCSVFNPIETTVFAMRSGENPCGLANKKIIFFKMSNS